MAHAQRQWIAQLLGARLSLRGSCWPLGVSRTWLLHFRVACVAACLDHRHAQRPARPPAVLVSRLVAEAAAMWRCVQQKANKHWLWSARETTTRPMMAFQVGDRRGESGKALWATMPLVDREQALFHTDQYAVYTGGMPVEQHRAITQHACNTKHIERFHNTLRQRVSRLVCETLSCSKKLAHHIGAIKYCIGHDNLEQAGALPL